MNRITDTIMPHKTIIRLSGVARNPANGFPARPLGTPEYWRFDETGEFYGTMLAGDRLVNNQYEPIPIETVEEGVLQGYSRVLNLHIRWEHGELRWHDPETDQHILRYSDLHNRMQSEEET